MSHLFRRVSVIAVLLLLTPLALAQAEDEERGWWENVVDQGRKALEATLEELPDFLDETDLTEEEVEHAKQLAAEEVWRKIDDIRSELDAYANLKKEQVSAPSFALISRSKKDYQVKIDKVLREIEPLLFDGEVVDYASRIRRLRGRIAELEEQQVELGERLVFTDDGGGMFSASKDDLRDKIESIKTSKLAAARQITTLERDLQRKMRSLGVSLEIEQIRVLTTRVDGDELSKVFAIFDVTKQITDSLEQLVLANSFNADATVSYYGVYVILSEILAYAQRSYIDKIANEYVPALEQIEDDVNDSIEFAKEESAKASLELNKKVFKQNIESNEFTLRVINEYAVILDNQGEQLEDALAKTEEQIAVAYSTFDTAVNATNLISLINMTQKNFDQLVKLQLPDIVPFENAALEQKFSEITNQINAQ